LEVIDAANSDRVAYMPWYLSPLHSKQTQTEANNFLRFSYSWRHRLKIVLYLAETETHWN
jgi:hypothetical protein